MGGLISTNRMVGQTLGATVLAALLALGLGQGRAPAFVAVALAIVAGGCSLARLRPTIRNPPLAEGADVQPAQQVK